jgi:hypothetical protein
MIRIVHRIKLRLQEDYTLEVIVSDMTKMI